MVWMSFGSQFKIQNLEYKILNLSLLDGLSAAARENPRRRANHNIHLDYTEPCQRLLNAVEPGTYIRPHRHLTPLKPESFIALRGTMAAIIFGEEGEILAATRLQAGGETFGIDIPGGVWHTVVALESGSVFFETKPGPYEPLSDKDWAPWAPAEGAAEAEGYLEKLVKTIFSHA